MIPSASCLEESSWVSTSEGLVFKESIQWDYGFGNPLYYRCSTNWLDELMQVHFFRPVPKEYLHSAELRDIMQFGSSNTAVFFKMRVAGVLHIFQFETKQVCFYAL